DLFEIAQGREHVCCMEHGPFQNIRAIHSRAEKLAGLFGQVETDGHGFENRRRLATGAVVVHQRRDLSVRVDLLIGCALLVALVNVDLMQLEWQADFLSHDQSAAAVCCSPSIKVHHCRSPSLSINSLAGMANQPRDYFWKTSLNKPCIAAHDCRAARSL